MTDLNELYGTVTDGGGNKTFVNPGNANDGLSHTFAELGAFAGGGLSTGYLDTDLGTARSVSGAVFDADAGCSVIHDAATFSWWYSDDGSSWTEIDSTNTANFEPLPGAETRNVSTWEWDGGAETHRYWRLRWQRVVGGFECGVRAYGWEVTEGIPEEPEEPTDPVPAPVEPNVGALLEIYVAAEGSYLWDVALWDEAVWSTSAWTDITYLGVVADVTWGVDNAERGILAPTRAASW